MQFKALQLRYNDRTVVDALPKILENYNATQHSAHRYACNFAGLITGRMTPSEMYNGSPEVIQKALEKSIDYRRKRIWKGATQNTDIPEGTLVRLSLQSKLKQRKLHQTSA